MERKKTDEKHAAKTEVVLSAGVGLPPASARWVVSFKLGDRTFQNLLGLLTRSKGRAQGREFFGEVLW